MDPSGQTQGPFPAHNMLEWYRRGLLNDMTLQTCGAVRALIASVSTHSEMVQSSCFARSWFLSPCCCMCMGASMLDLAMIWEGEQGPGRKEATGMLGRAGEKGCAS